MTQPPKPSLRWRFLLVVGLALAPMALLLGRYIIEERDLSLARLNADVMRVADQSAGTLAQLTRGSWQTLASLSVVSLQTTNPVSMSQAFADVLGHRGLYESAGLAQADGRVIASVNPAERGGSCAAMEWFRRAQQARTFCLGGYERDGVTKKERLGFAMPVGAMSSNLPSVAYLGMTLDALQRVIEQPRLPGDSLLVVVDRNGLELARWPEARRIQGTARNPGPQANQGTRGRQNGAWDKIKPQVKRQSEPVEWVGEDQIARIYFFQPVPASGQGLWVGVGLSKTDVVSQMSRKLGWGLGISAFVFLFGMGVAWTGMERWVLRPVRQLTETARRLSGGDWGARFNTAGVPAELAVFGATFDEMAETLHNREEELRRTQFAVDHAPDLIVWTDSNGRFIYGNESALRVLGVTLEELRQRHISDITNFITPGTWMAHWEELKRRRLLYFEAVCRGRDREFPVEAAANYLFFGEREYDCVFLRDISRRKQAEENWRRLNVELENRVRERTAELESSNTSLVEEIEERHKIELSLRESERKLAMFLSNLPGLAYRCRNERDWQMEFVSQGAFELTGYTARELVGNAEVSYASLIHPEDAGRIWAEVQAALILHETFRLVYRIRCRDGREKWVSEIGQGVFNDAGGLVALEGIIHDTTERKQAEEDLFRAHAMLGMVLDHVPQRVFWKDLNSRFLGCNVAFAADQGLERPQDVAGKTDADLFSPEEAEAHVALDRWVIENKQPKLNYEQPRVNANGERRWLRISKMPMQNQKGEVVGVLGAYEDITEAKKMEQVMRESLQTLERSNRELEQFAYVASHDLQEPLRLIASYTQLLATRYQGKLDARADEFIAYAVDGAKRMQRLIQDLLAYSRVANRDVAMVPVDCQALMEIVARNLSVVIQETGAKVTWESLPVIQGSDNQMAQLLQNLVGNAIKFHGAQPPEVHVSAQLSDNGKEWVFAVRDNGIGIAPEFFERIFVIFQRLHSRRKYEGTGIGLAICKRIVERHGGRIWVESEPEKGSTFCFTVPKR
jgi:PAS domain S-box-containing protein